MGIMNTTHWQKVEKKYFKDDPVRPCYVESDTDRSGSPLWPRDERFHPEKISHNLELAHKELATVGGEVFYGHLKLSDDRKTFLNFELEQNPTPLESVFVSAILIPTDKITSSEIGFHLKEGSIPKLSETIKHSDQMSVVTNLGHCITRNLIIKHSEGGRDYSHNQRHDFEESLPESMNSYLGGFFVRGQNELIAGPVLFGTAGVGVRQNGQPVLIDDIKLKGGKVQIGEASFSWTAQDVNPEIASQPVVLYTPSFNAKNSDTQNWKNYEKRIGENRINIVIMNQGDGSKPVPIVAYVKEGSLKQPAGAVVLSLDNSLRNQLPKQFTDVKFEFEPWFEKNLWDDLVCFYEGLIGFHKDGSPNFDQWKHPHAILTQETYIPNPIRREPRLCFAQMKNHFGIFVFSGRYQDSIGLSYQEVFPVIQGLLKQRKINETIESIICLDSGSSVKACLVKNNDVLPLNWVAPGSRNQMGDEQGNTHSTMTFQIAGV